MKTLLRFTLLASAASISVAAFAADSTTSGTISANVPTTAAITPINSSDLNFGALDDTQLQSAKTVTTNVSVYTNSTSDQDLCLETQYGKYSSTENLPYLSPGTTDLSPIYLQSISYRACGGASAHVYTGLEAAKSVNTTLSAGNGGNTETQCLGASGTPGLLTITTKPSAPGSTPHVGGEYTETITMGVGPAGCA